MGNPDGAVVDDSLGTVVAVMRYAVVVVAVVGKELYLISDKGILTVLDAVTGEEIYTERIGGNFSASPLYADLLVAADLLVETPLAGLPGVEFGLLALPAGPGLGVRMRAYQS